MYSKKISDRGGGGGIGQSSSWMHICAVLCIVLIFKVGVFCQN